MKIYQTQTQYYKVLMNPIRLAILDLLRDGEQCVCHMETVLGLRQAKISQHLMVLRSAGLVSDRRDGWNIFYQVIKPEIYQVMDAMNALSGESADHSLFQVKKAARACPCPKCNAGETAPSSERPVILVDNLKMIG